MSSRAKQRFLCCACRRTWSCKAGKTVTKQMRQTTRDHLERKSLRIIGRGEGTSKTTIMKVVHLVTAEAKNSVWIAKRFRPSWSGVLVVDGKGVKVFDRIVKYLDTSKFSSQQLKRLHRKVWICGIDHLTGDLPHYALADEETKIDLVMFFRVLKEQIRYDLRVLICDGNEDIVLAARKVYGNTFLVQRCTRHYTEGLKYRASRLGVLEHPRTQELIEVIKGIVYAKNLAQTNERLMVLKRKRFKHVAHQQILQDFYEDVDTLTTHLQYPHLPIPRTNNDIENLFRQVNQRLTTMCRFGKFSYADNYMRVWALMRRFTPFTDCKGKRRVRNGITPLELAGCDIDGIDYLDL